MAESIPMLFGRHCIVNKDDGSSVACLLRMLSIALARKQYQPIG